MREESTPLRWFSAARETSPCDPGAFARKVEAARRPVSELAAPARLKRLATVTALQLARAFDWPEQEQQGERFRLRREGGQVTVETATLSGSAGREAATP